MRLNKITLAIYIASVSVSASAGNTVPTTLLEVTVSASPIQDHDIFEVPSQIDVLSGLEKKVHESGSLGQMLEGIPGVNNLSSGTQSGKPVIRGLTGSRVNVLSNGQSTDYQAYGTRHLANVDPYLADRIEVIRGPQSVLYGAGSMGGIVNVIQPDLPYGQAISGEVAAEYNSNNQETLLGAKVGMGSQDFAIQAGVSKRSADNFTVPSVSVAPGNVARDKRPLFVGDVPNTNFDNQAANIGIGYQQDWGMIELRHTQWLSKQNYLGVEGSGTAVKALATGQKLQNDETQLSGEFYSDNGWVIKPNWTHTRNAREASHDLPYETMVEDKGTPHYLDLLVKRNDFKVALEHPKLGVFEGEVGIELSEKQQDLRSGDLTPTAHESKRAIYLFEETDYNKWLVQMGARYDWQETAAPLGGANIHFVDEGIFDGSNNHRKFNVFSSSLGTTYRIDSNWSVAANLASGFRAPSVFELYAGGEHGGVQAYQLGNPDLKAEVSLNTDLSLRWQAPKTQMVATVYQNWIDNYIYLANELEADGVTVKTKRNEANTADLPVMKAQQTDAIIHGVELSIKHQIDQAWSTDVALELIEGSDTQNNQTLPLMPANNLRVNLHYQPQNVAQLHDQKFTLGVKLVDSKNKAGAYEPFAQFDDKPFGTASTNAYAVWNLGYQAQIKMDKQALYLGASVDNLFDTGYVDFLNTYKGYTLNPGRNIKLSMRLSF